MSRKHFFNPCNISAYVPLCVPSTTKKGGTYGCIEPSTVIIVQLCYGLKSCLARMTFAPFMGLMNVINSIHCKWNNGITVNIDKETDACSSKMVNTIVLL